MRAEVYRIADGQRAEVTDRFSRCNFFRCYPNEIVEVIINDRRTLIAGVVVLYLDRRAAIPEAILDSSLLD